MRHAMRADISRNKLTLNTQRIGKRIIARLIDKKPEIDAVTNNRRLSLDCTDSKKSNLTPFMDPFYAMFSEAYDLSTVRLTLKILNRL